MCMLANINQLVSPTILKTNMLLHEWRAFIDDADDADDDDALA